MIEHGRLATVMFPHWSMFHDPTWFPSSPHLLVVWIEHLHPPVGWWTVAESVLGWLQQWRPRNVTGHQRQSWGIHYGLLNSVLKFKTYWYGRCPQGTSSAGTGGLGTLGDIVKLSRSKQDVWSGVHEHLWVTGGAWSWRCLGGFLFRVTVAEETRSPPKKVCFRWK